MTVEAANDVLERRYQGKFQALAAEYGVIVRYERDRAARDVGLHLFRRTKSGHEAATGSLVWFQMKGLHTATLSREAFAAAEHIPVTLKVDHLRLWYRMHGPTFLALYIESVDRFLVLNLVKYVRDTFGATILSLKQETVSVPVLTSSVLDAQAFELMLANGTRDEWARVLEATSSDSHFAARDYRLIWRLATAEERRVEHRLDVVDWQSKCRGEIALLERAIGGDDDTWQSVRFHMEFMLSIDELAAAYPYLEFEDFDQERHDSIAADDNEDDEPEFTFDDGSVVYGWDAAGEYYAYELRPQLNSRGRQLANMVRILIAASLVEAPELDESELLDVAPWNHREI